MVQNKKIFVIATMNYNDKTAERLLSRMRTVIRAELPDYQQRLNIISFYRELMSKDVSFDSLISFHDVAMQTKELSHREIGSIFEKARFSALVRPNNKNVTKLDMQEAIDLVISYSAYAKTWSYKIGKIYEKIKVPILLVGIASWSFYAYYFYKQLCSKTASK